mmetsp:Transcript_45708/g.99318  ORF Transcript_45708/g.99318 Transcript_45708/m.99318 type:complete len:427 (-) Transcript_45708:111-1391(-)
MEAMLRGFSSAVPWMSNSEDRSGNAAGSGDDGSQPAVGSGSACPPVVLTSLSYSGVRSACSGYVEHNVVPVLRSLQEGQARLQREVEELRSQLQQKVDAEEHRACAEKLAGLEKSRSLQPEEVSRGLSGGVQAASAEDPWPPAATTVQEPLSPGVPVLTQLKELAAQVSRKPDSSTVPTQAQFRRLYSALDQKADSSSHPTMADFTDLVARVESLAAREGKSPEPVPDLQPGNLQEIAQEIHQKLHEARELHAKMVQAAKVHSDEEAAATLAHKAEEVVQVRKIQVLVAAAGSRFDKQLHELRKQFRELREEIVNNGAGADPSSRWPGRQMGELPLARTASTESEDLGSAMAESISEVGSAMTGLGAEEKAELKKIQAIMGAAGTHFSKEIRELRREILDLKDTVNVLSKNPDQAMYRAASGDSSY